MSVPPGAVPVEEPSAFYVTTPIYYVNDAPHIGHAYTTVAADVLARWHRQRGERTWFLTGTDEHGQKVLRTALAHDLSPQEWCDRPSRVLAPGAHHARRVERRLHPHDGGAAHPAGAGVLAGAARRRRGLPGSYEGPYCVGCEEFKLEGELLDPTEGPANPGGRAVPDPPTPVEWLAETNYFFRMSAYAERLLAHYEATPSSCSPRRRATRSWRSCAAACRTSRSRVVFDWGIPIPWDTRTCLYVWIDALAELPLRARRTGRRRRHFARDWPGVHIVGKDIPRFHAVDLARDADGGGLAVPKNCLRARLAGSSAAKR